MTKAISIEHFSKSFGKNTVIDNLSFSVTAGEIFSYLGSNGSGKTTTIRCLLNIYKADIGELLFWGKPFNTSLYNRIGYLPEERGLYLGSGVGEVLEYFAKLKGMSSFDAKKAVTDFLQKVELADKRDTNIKKLSSGQQQKIQFGLALIHKPDILILDEPMKGLDPVNRRMFITMILEEKARGATILFSSHQMEDVEKMADSILILKKGRIGVCGNIETVKKDFQKTTIKLVFSGNFPENPDLYNATVSNTFAEITPNEGVDEQQILKFFIEKGLSISKFDISLPSLNDIFLAINT